MRFLKFTSDLDPGEATKLGGQIGILVGASVGRLFGGVRALDRLALHVIETDVILVPLAFVVVQRGSRFVGERLLRARIGRGFIVVGEKNGAHWRSNSCARVRSLSPRLMAASAGCTLLTEPPGRFSVSALPAQKRAAIIGPPSTPPIAIRIAVVLSRHLTKSSSAATRSLSASIVC